MSSALYPFFRSRRLMLNALLLLIILQYSNIQQINGQGIWTPMNNLSPNPNYGVMLLLSDGTVMCKTTSGSNDGSGTIWDRLTPDSSGSYINGTWTSFNPMINSRLYFASQVLMDGRVFVAGGEYGSGGDSAETFDPMTGVWTAAPFTHQYYGDANSEILPDGKVMVGILDYFSGYRSTAVFDPVANSWLPNPPSCINSHEEATWVKLADGSILFVDFLATSSERYIPSLGQWVADANTPASLWDTFEYETGPAFLLPDGRALFLGSLGNTALYTPSGTASPGTWAAGPDMPAGFGTGDACGAVMPDGHILFDASSGPDETSTYPSPTVYFEYDYLANTFDYVSPPLGGYSSTEPSYVTNMLDLPDGNIMYSEFNSNQYFVYTPGSAPLAAGKPTVDTIVQTDCDSFIAIGTLFNGITEGAAYGDDWQMATNYPIIRLTQGSRVYYTRTFDWNSTGVQTGSQLDTVHFKLPSGIPAGSYSLQVIANGNSSAPFPFTTPSLPYLTSTLAPAAICTGTPFSYTASATAGASYTWTRAAVPGISDSAVTVPQTADPNELLVNTTLNPLTVLYNYAVTDAGCSVTEQVAATILSLPDTGYITASGSTTLCIGDTIYLEDSYSGSASIVWSVTGDITWYTTVSLAGDYYVTNTNICGYDTSNHIHVTSLPYALPAVALNGFGSDTVCANSGPVVLTGTPLWGTLVYNGYDTLINGSTFDPDSALGNNSFSYYYTDSHGCSNSATQNVLVEICTGVKDLAATTASLTVYPNPAGDLLHIDAGGMSSGTVTLSLYDIDGQVMSAQQIAVTESSLSTQLSIQQLSAGIYFLTLSSETAKETIKVVKY